MNEEIKVGDRCRVLFRPNKGGIVTITAIELSSEYPYKTNGLYAYRRFELRPIAKRKPKPMPSPKQKPFSIPKVMYAVVCSKNREVEIYESREDAKVGLCFRKEVCRLFKVHCTHKVVKVSVKKVK